MDKWYLVEVVWISVIGEGTEVERYIMQGDNAVDWKVRLEKLSNYWKVLHMQKLYPLSFDEIIDMTSTNALLKYNLELLYFK